MKEVLLKITGKVQGVFYRARAQEKAIELGLTGYAKNLSDGSVEILLQGKENVIRQFIEWAYDGSPHARVEKVDIIWREAERSYAGFTRISLQGL